MNSPTSGEIVNPMLPTSIGALLAEEWTIDPQSMLPSFLEMMMMEEARRSGHYALKSFFSHAEQRLSTVADETSSSEVIAAPTSENGEAANEATVAAPNSFSVLWSRIKKRISLVLVEKIRLYGPEIRFFILYLIERGSLLSNASASVSESVYGGKRVKLGPPSKSGTKNDNVPNQRKLIDLPKRDGIRLAFLIAFGPYLAERGDSFYRNLSQLDGSFAASLSLKVKKILKVIYPFLHMSIQGLHLLEQYRYLLGFSVYFDPYSRYLNLVVRRVTEQDQQSLTSSNSQKSKNGSNILESTLDKSRSLINSNLLKKASLGILSFALTIGWMARIQSARREFRRSSQGRQLGEEGQEEQTDERPLFPPPPKPMPAINSDLVNLPSTVCPLCRQPRVNPTASTGGYVFCLKCIKAHLKEKKTCPITGRDCPDSSLVRLFEPHPS